MKSNALLTSVLIYISLFLAYIAGIIEFDLSHSLIADIILILAMSLNVINKNEYFRLDLIFFILFPFYFKISFFTYEWYGIAIFETPRFFLLKTYLICQISWLFILILYLIRPSIVNFKIHSENVISYFELNKNLSTLFFPFTISLTISVFYIIQIYPYLGSDISNFSRLEITELVGHSGWYLKYIIIGYSFFYISKIPLAFETKKYFAILIYSAPIIIYLYYQMFLGGRREIISMLLFLVGFYVVYKKGKISKYFLGSIFLILLLFLLVGVFRDFGEDNFVKIVTDALGEFIFPISTLQVHVAEDLDPKMGLSYFYTFSNFIPSSIFPEKPFPLAVQFALMVAGPNQESILGYAITPLTESYVNFGIASILLLPIFISIFSILVEYISQVVKPIAIVFFSQSLNFQRSDFSSIAFELTILIISIGIIKIISIRPCFKRINVLKR